MTETMMNQGGEASLQDVKAFVAQWMKCLSDMQQALEENEQLRQRVAALESENAALTETVEQWKKSDEWSNRVTYDNVVDQIASLEDTSKNDQGMFSQCREIVLKLVDEFGKASHPQE